MFLVEVGGMLVTPEEMESETGPKKAEGSLLIIKAGTIAEARKLIESDVYFTSGVVSCCNYAISGWLIPNLRTVGQRENHHLAIRPSYPIPVRIEWLRAVGVGPELCSSLRQV